MDQQELQRIAQLVEMNRQKMARIEEQMTRLSEIRMEQLGVIASLKVLATEQPTMIPLGAGVQLPASPTGDTVVIDIGSGVQAEKPRAEAIEILENRLNEVTYNFIEIVIYRSAKIFWNFDKILGGERVSKEKKTKRKKTERG